MLNEEGRILERGSFDDLHSADGYVSALGLNKSTLQEVQAIVEQEEEEEKNEKEEALVKIASKKTLAELEDATAVTSRGKRNADALFSYIRAMGNVYFPIFCVFTIFNVGFRSAQREFLNSSLVHGNLLTLYSFMA